MKVFNIVELKDAGFLHTRHSRMHLLLSRTWSHFACDELC